MNESLAKAGRRTGADAGTGVSVAAVLLPAEPGLLVPQPSFPRSSRRCPLPSFPVIPAVPSGVAIPAKLAPAQASAGSGTHSIMAGRRTTPPPGRDARGRTWQ